MRITLFGASGTIGAAVARELVAQKHNVTGVYRTAPKKPVEGVHPKVVDLTDPQTAFAAAKPDIVISCLASRTGGPKDAWAIDYQANSAILKGAHQAGAKHFILLSAICVQKPRLAFQHAKLAFEKELRESGMSWSIIRPTAFFKSLSGQVGRVREGKPFLLFGNGQLTRCTPISDADLARYIVGCIDDPARHNATLPIGGPGPAITPREQGAMLFELTGRKPRFRSVTPALFKGIAATLNPFGTLSQRVADTAEYLRIAHYYATESMLVLDPGTGEYSEKATPQFGSDTLRDHYRKLLEN